MLQADRTTDVVVRVVKPAPAGSIDAHFQRTGATFDLIEPNGAAAKAGLQIGDQVITVDGASVADLYGDAAMQVITQRAPGSVAALTILRAGATRTISVTVHG
jgi:S1-C subfamily serine protease